MKKSKQNTKVSKNAENTTLIILIVLTASFIFSQSLLSADISSSESGHVMEIINGFLAKIGAPQLTHHIVRKLAHFCEHGLLGIEYTLLFSKKSGYMKYLIPVNLGLITAFLDETIQMFTGRGPAILDVWIDLGGNITAVICMSILLALFRCIKKNGETNAYKEC